MNYNIILNKGRLQAVNMPDGWEYCHSYTPDNPSIIEDCSLNKGFAYCKCLRHNEGVKKAKSEAIDFRPEDFIVGKSLLSIRTGDRWLAFALRKEGETYPVPDGFDIFLESDYKSCGCKIDCRANLRGGKCTATKYARLVPNKEQKKHYAVLNPVECFITCPFCGEKDFDKAGLKFHLVYNCKDFDNTENL